MHERLPRIFVGYDPSEAIAYHVFCESLISVCRLPLTITPLALNNLTSIYSEQHLDGSNQFIYSRFLVPFLSGFSGQSIFFDGDMIAQCDPIELLEFINAEEAVSVVQHDYRTKFPIKYFGNANQDYPRKNWSSVIIFNNSHPSNRVLTPEFVKKQPGSYLHRFEWLNEREIGNIPTQYNWLVNEYSANPDAQVLHYTLGIPCIRGFQDSDCADIWYEHFTRLHRGVSDEQ